MKFEELDNKYQESLIGRIESAIYTYLELSHMDDVELPNKEEYVEFFNSYDEDYKIENLNYLYGDMVIRIRDGIVKIVEETCPKHYCSMGEISKPGQTLICAPNNVYVTITNEDKVVDDPGIII